MVEKGGCKKHAPFGWALKRGTKKGTFDGNTWKYMYHISIYIIYIIIYIYIQSSSNGLLEAYFLVILQVFSECDFCLDQRIVKSGKLINALKYPQKGNKEIEHLGNVRIQDSK